MPVVLLRALALSVAAALFVLPSAPAEAQRRGSRAAAAPVDNATRLNRLYAEYWDALMKLDPLQATLQGDPRYNDQLPNTLSLAFRQQYHEFNQQWLARVEAIGDAGLGGQDLLSYQLFVRDIRAALAGRDQPGWMMPVSAYYSPATLIALLGSGAAAQPFESVRDYENWSRRSLGIPALFNQAIDNMRAGIAAGVVPPRSLVEPVLAQLDAVLAAGNAEESLFWGPVRTMPESFSDEDRQRLAAEYRRMIDNRILPAYRALRGFIASEYLPATRSTDGLDALPGGEAWYAQIIAQHAAGPVDPDALHAEAVAEVARLQQQIDSRMRELKIRGRRERLVQALHNPRQQAFASPQALIQAYQQAHQRLAAPLAAVLPDLPLAPLEIVELPAERALTASAASYQPPAGTDAPGQLWVNTHDLARRPRWAVTQQYLHEAIPGHHLQLGLRVDTSALPRFRRHTGDTAFVEGWGLYAESLGLELGLYSSAHEELGYLYSRLVRAARMAADTGLHANGWSRARATQWLQHEAALGAEEAAGEVERMMAMPGQALAYRLGAMHLLQLRAHAQQVLGERFDLRAFHAEVLRDGSLPLDVLSAKIERWLASQANAPATTTSGGEG